MSLAAPLFLLGLALLALPFWLHRLTAQQSDRRSFSSLMFMQQGQEQRLVRRRLRHPWLLAMKLLAISIAVTAFARPLVESAKTSHTAERITLHVLVVDISLSMGIGDRWQRARAQAATVISGLGRGDEVMLVAAAQGLDVLVGPGRNTGAVESALARVAPGDERLVFAGLLRRVASTARAVTESDVAMHLHLVSDFQASAAAVRFGDLPAGEGVAFTLHDVAAQREDNWVVEQIRTFSGARSNRVEVAVRSFARTDAERRVELALGGEIVGTSALHIPAGGRAVHQFTGIEAPRGDSRIEAVLAPSDALAADDRRRAVMANREAEKVLVMVRESSGADGLYFRAALEASPELGVRAEIRAPEQWDELHYGEFPLVVLSDPPMFDSALTQSLARYVDAGGAALIFLGDEARRNGRVELTGHLLRRSGGIGGGREFSRVAEADGSHPVSAGARHWTDVSFYQHVEVALGADDRVLVRLEGGAPLLIEHEFGLGRVLIFTAALDREWSNLSIEPVFIPWLNSTIRYLSGLRRTALEERVVGMPFNVSSAGVQLFDPDGDKVLTLAQTLGGADVILERVGFYEVNTGGEARLVAVNFDLRESDPRRVDEAVLTQWQAASPQTTAGEVTDRHSEDSPLELWPWLMAALLILMLAESLGGNWLLRNRVAA